MLTLLFKAFSHFILRPPCKEGMGSERTGNLLQVTRIGSGRARCEPGPAWFHYSSQPPNKHHCKKIQICSFLFKVKSLSRVRLCDPVDCSLPGSSVHGIFQARVLEWVPISFSRGSSWPRDQTSIFMSPALAGGFLSTEPPGKCQMDNDMYLASQHSTT